MLIDIVTSGSIWHIKINRKIGGLSMLTNTGHGVILGAVTLLKKLTIRNSVKNNSRYLSRRAAAYMKLFSVPYKLYWKLTWKLQLWYFKVIETVYNGVMSSCWHFDWGTSNYIRTIVLHYFSRGSGCEVLWWVCLSVCMSVCLSAMISPEPHAARAIFTKFFGHIAYVRGSVLLPHVDDWPHRLSAGRGWRECTARAKCNLRLPCLFCLMTNCWNRIFLKISRN